jgi:cell division GTPase FtsZ
MLKTNPSGLAITNHMPNAVHIIGIGHAGNALLKTQRFSNTAKKFLMTGADYDWDGVQNLVADIHLSTLPALCELPPAQEALIATFFETARGTNVTNVNGFAFARNFIESKRNAIKRDLDGAKAVLLMVGLDSTIAFAACDLIAKFAKELDALIIALVCTEFSDQSTDHQDAIQRLLHVADCVIFSQGHWEQHYREFEIRSWTWGWNSSVASMLERVISDATYPNLTKIIQTLSKSGHASFGTGFGGTLEAAVSMAIGNGLMGNWGGCVAEKVRGAIAVVSAHPSLMCQAAISVKQMLTINPNRQNKSFPWEGTPELIILSNPCDDLTDCFGIEILFFGIEF